MADKKISALPPSTTPLAGTEVLPIVQSGVTKQVSVANLTAGRAISATQVTSTIATGTAPFVVASTTEVANLKAATATLADSATSANAVKSNATTGLLQITGPVAASTRVMTTPDANFTVARTDAAQTFTGTQVAGNWANGFTSTVSAAGTTTLTSSSTQIQKLTGSTTQTYKLPDATTMATGTAFIFDNDSTGILTVVDNASGAITTVVSGSVQYVYLMTNATSAGTWGKYSWVSGAGALSVTTAKSASITNSITFSGTDSTTITFPATSVSVGYLEIPQNSQSVDYTLALTDSGKHIFETGASKTITIPANGSIPFPIGTAITIVADANSVSIAITSDTLRWAVDGSTGTRSLAAYGIATILKTSSTEWRINGTGVS